MKQTERWDCLFSGLDKVIGMITGLLVLSLGLWIYGLQLQDASNVAQMLLAFFLSAWIGAVGMAGTTLIPVWLVVRTKKCR
ncbi:hypothetical protein MYX04_07660 [Nitrospiraceae bacterium AH_259_D15_M11_P09]|nr:hypothetical protein [Nitrospiraceae bacterium AH_259_D15_M11_P09]